MDNLKLPEKPTIQEFQKYVAAMVKERGLESQSVPDIFMLLTEECGELAKAARQQLKMKQDVNSEQFDLENEFADIFILTLSLCNRFNIDLEEAFRRKEEKNKQRVWK